MLQIFLATMMHHPEVWEEAQREMDAVIGRDRFPTTEDECRLPYLRAVQYECQRFRPVVPLSMSQSLNWTSMSNQNDSSPTPAGHGR